MPRDPLFSTLAEREKIRDILLAFTRLPFGAAEIPGAVMEAVLAHVRGASVLRTYDFVDVISDNLGVGWQVKSTLAGTPVTWKRAKIPNATALIAASHQDAAGLQALGDALLAFCNAHAAESLEKFELKSIGYARLLISPAGSVTYFEKKLCDAGNPDVFTPGDFEWRWSAQKNTVKKEQLRALHGIHRPTGKKWFAWHGLGENQLHFSGEREWWPKAGEDRSISFQLPVERLTFDDLAAAVQAYKPA